jgi:uncharacterized protein (UPF0276 family)
MQLAVNYSHPLRDLVQSGAVRVDAYKCPAWPDLVAEAQASGSPRVHFPLSIGDGSGQPRNEETRELADWGLIDGLLRDTDTTLVNLHFSPRAKHFPDIPADTTDPALFERIIEAAVRDVNAVIERYGVDRVIMENGNPYGSEDFAPAVQPDVIRPIIEATGAGLLLDVSHARLAAAYLGMDVYDYFAALPLRSIREMHVTGIRMLDDGAMPYLRERGFTDKEVRPYFGRRIDHVAMTDADWDFFGWVMGEVRAGRWGEPGLVGFEYGGVGGIWEKLADTDFLRVQVPRLFSMVHAAD